MPFVPADDTALIEMLLTVNGQQAENTLWVRQTGQWDETDLLDVAGTVANWWKTNMRAQLHTSVTLRGVRATSMETPTSPSIEFTVSSDNTGTLTGNVNPNNVAFTVTFLTAFRGRSNRGRNYIGGIPISVMSDANHVTTAWANAVVTAYELLPADLDNMTKPGELVVASRYSGKNAQGKPLPRSSAVLRPVTGFRYADLTIDSQRRRLPGRGQ